jgi:hypothetical protein
MSESKAAHAVQKSNAAIADHVMDWMANNCPSWTVDSLLTHPIRAAEMAGDVCRKLHRRPTPENLHEVCRVGLNARKRGDIRRDGM